MLKWDMVFRELDDALEKVSSKYKPTSQMHVIAMQLNHSAERWRVPFKQIKQQIWTISSDYPNTAILSVRTIRNKVIYEVVRYPMLTGQGTGAGGDAVTIEKFSNLKDDDRELIVKLLHSQIQDRYVTEDAANEQSK